MGSFVSSASRILRLTVGAILWGISGSLLIATFVAGIRWNQVRASERDARLLLAAWRFEEAISELEAIEPWSRCFPGFYTENLLLRIQSLVRQGQWRKAWPLAEAIRHHPEKPLRFPSPSDFTTAPLPALHHLGLALIGRLSQHFHPPRTLNAWAGYAAILQELKDQQNDDDLNAFQEAVTRQFPRSPIAIQTSAAPRRADLQPRRPPAPRTLSPSSPQPPAPEQVRIRPSPPPEEETLSTASEAQPAFGWGIVTNREAFAYHPRTSAPVRPLQAGDVVVMERFFTLRNREAAEGVLILTNGTVPELAFLLQDLELRPGSYQETDPREVMWRSRLVRLLAEEGALRAQLEREQRSRKPEEIAYENAVRRYQELQNRARALQAQLDQPGANRSSILERLRAMRYEEAALAREVQTHKQKLENTGESTAKRIEQELLQLTQDIQEARQTLTRLTSS